ncbi:hypothetical protein L1987_18160 [Smallanthus sonchifolius]|uniref:Uncharacterized protein n=1 Tax=Smallanthus sonchifolius TaxID=185202 RepID=A0ACB9J018_9ASTR|nr:hypothetical protein L1987_18160 [Smallanthus sonchifolius]
MTYETNVYSSLLSFFSPSSLIIEVENRVDKEKVSTHGHEEAVIENVITSINASLSGAQIIVASSFEPLDNKGSTHNFMELMAAIHTLQSKDDKKKKEFKKKEYEDEGKLRESAKKVDEIAAKAREEMKFIIPPNI